MDRLTRRGLMGMAAATGAVLALPSLITAGAAGAARAQGAGVRPAVVPQAMVEGLREPWAFGFLPDGRILVTERGGRLSMFAAGGGRAEARVTGVPEVVTGGQGGLLDIMVPRDFERTREVFLSFSRPQGDAAGTALGVGRLAEDGRRLEAFRVIFEIVPGGRGGRHFGSRIVELRDGMLALTIGDRGNDALAQDLTRHEGKVIRINRDGSVPSDNPFVGRADARPEIWSYGHRNPQGAALDAAGQLWVSEHGARGGDEVNRVRRGANFGWPVISYGRHYSGARIGIGTDAPGMEQPAHYWDPSIAPSGHAVCSGRMFPEWRGRHLVGSLKLDHISVLDPASRGPSGWAETRLELPETGRVRDIREASDGAIWFLSVRRSALYRLVRADA